MRVEAWTAVAEAHRQHWAFVLASATRITRDLDLAEECSQEAYAQALTSWVNEGVPDRPGAWLTTVARRRAIDLIRRNDILRDKLPLLVDSETAPAADAAFEGSDIPDDRLRLIFTCCHPALPVEVRVALTLRLVCGLSTAEVARAFLVSESTMAARITRGKRKIKVAGIPFREPVSGELSDRLEPVVDVIHLVFTTGHTAPRGHDLQRRDLVEQSIHLARLLHKFLPDQPGPTGVLALILLTDARRETRVDAHGNLVLLREQDRALWDRTAIHEGLMYARAAFRRGAPSRYALMAGIAAVHAQADQWDQTDWKAIVELYDTMTAIWPSPVVALNRAIAIGEGQGPEEGLAALGPLVTDPQLVGYHYLAATRADFLRRLGRVDEAIVAYEEALLLAENEVERAFLADKAHSLRAAVDSAALPFDK